MKQAIWTTATAAILCLAAVISMAECRSLEKRETAHIDPQFQEVADHSINRDKRKVEVVTGVKNAVLGFVFNKLNSFIDQKTAWIDQLDRTNIAKNAAHNIYPPADPVVSLSGIISGVIGEKLQAAAPLISVVTNKLTSGSSSGGHPGFNFGALISKGIGGSSGHGSAGHNAI